MAGVAEEKAHQNRWDVPRNPEDTRRWWKPPPPAGGGGVMWAKAGKTVSRVSETAPAQPVPCLSGNLLKIRCKTYKFTEWKTKATPARSTLIVLCILCLKTLIQEAYVLPKSLQLLPLLLKSSDIRKQQRKGFKARLAECAQAAAEP